MNEILNSDYINPIIVDKNYITNIISDNPNYAEEKAKHQAKIARKKNIEAAKELLRRKKARKSLYEFLKYVWWKNDAFIEGQHLKDICAELDIAIEKLLDPESDESSYLDIAVCFGHAKSTVCSIALPAYLLGRSHGLIDLGVLMTGYGASLIEGFSKVVKVVINSDPYKHLFPNIEIPHGSNSAKEWGVTGSTGRVSAVSLGGQITGKRVHLLIVDDYFKSLVEARSKTNRDKLWNGFKSDVMSRLMPKSIVLVVATPWHQMGIQGRIKEAEQNDPEFPQFRHVKFAAKVRNDNGEVLGYLWPDMYPNSWYETAYATNRGSMANALLDCEPISTEGNRFDIEGIREHDLGEFPDARYIRAWDLASSTKQRSSENPDWTCGVLGYINCTKNALGEKETHFWIKDMVLMREEAPARNAKIKEVAHRDSTRIPIVMEDYGPYKDAFTTMKHILSGHNITGQHLHRDKSAKASGLEPIFTHGRVHIPKGAVWKDEFIRQFSAFPDGDHDDIVDTCAIIYNDSMHRGSSILVYK